MDRYDILGGLGEAISALEDQEYRGRAEARRLVEVDIAGFPRIVFRDEGLPRLTELWSCKLFPLGDFRPIWLGSVKGYTTLYIGSDGSLYEYGPRVRQPDWFDPDESVWKPTLADNHMELRRVYLSDMSVADLCECSVLLRRVWL